MEDFLIESTSPYVNGSVVDYGDGTYNLSRVDDPSLYFDTSAGGSYYITRDGDEIDALAQKFYGDFKLWHIIAASNPDIINFMQLEPGTTLYIPSPQQFQK